MIRLFSVLILLTIIACGGMWYWTTTPQYSIDQIKESLKSHDRMKFDKHVNMNDFASGMVDDVLTEPFKEVMGGGMIGRWIVAGISGFVKPSIVSGVKDELYDLVDTGDLNKSEGGTVHNLNDRLCLTQNDFKRISQIKTEGKLANVTLVLHNVPHNKDLDLDVQMRDMGGYWQVTKMLNFPEFAGELSALENSGDGVHKSKGGIKLNITDGSNEQADEQSNVETNINVNVSTKVRKNDQSDEQSSNEEADEQANGQSAEQADEQTENQTN